MLTFSLWFGCGAPPPPPEVVVSCGSVFDALVADLGATFAATGTGVTFPDRAAFVAQCEQANLSDAALGCLRPAVAVAEPDRCAAALAQADALATWFDAHTTIGPRVR
ncbi:MAG: hypothetical protein ABMA64_21810 [Myxococcota bacterium]